MPNLVTGFPRHTGDLQRDSEEYYDWAVSLIDELKQLLNNLDAGNIVEVEAEKVKELPEMIQEIVEEMGGGGQFDGVSLEVDRLNADWAEIGEVRYDGSSTSQAPYMYLLWLETNGAAGTDDDIFVETDAYDIQGHESAVYFVQNAVKRDANLDPLPAVNYTDRYGNPLYWEKEVVQSRISGGIPYDENGERILMTRSEVTDYPVLAFQYDTLSKIKITQLRSTGYGIEITANIGQTETKGIRIKNTGVFQIRGAEEHPVRVIGVHDTEADAIADSTLRDGDIVLIRTT